MGGSLGHQANLGVNIERRAGDSNCSQSLILLQSGHTRTLGGWWVDEGGWWSVPLAPEHARSCQGKGGIFITSSDLRDGKRDESPMRVCVHTMSGAHTVFRNCFDVGVEIK